MMRVVAWHLGTFGRFLLLLGLWGLWHVRRGRAALLLLALGGLAVPLLVVSYPYVKNIAKFSTVAALALGILSGAALAWLAAKRTLGRRVALLGCLLALLASPVVLTGTTLWVLFAEHDTPAPTAVFATRAAPASLQEDDRQAMAWLRVHAKPDEIIYRLPAVALGYCQWGGLPATCPAIPIGLNVGITKERFTSRSRLLDALPRELEPYRAEGIVWFVVGPDDPQMERNVREWEPAGDVVLQAQFQALRILKISDRDAKAQGLPRIRE